MSVQIALLRAVNLAGRARVGMAALREALEREGLPGARTLLQSGNVVLPVAAPGGAALERRLEEAIAGRLGVETAVLVRDRAEWESMIAANPFAEAARAEPARLLVAVAREAPAPGAAEALEAAVPGRERVRLGGRHAYLHYPDGIGRSRLTTALIERHLGTIVTARNWTTVTRLAGLAAEAAGAAGPG